MANRLGHSLTITSFGESHGVAVGVVLDGFPSGFPIQNSVIQKELDRRKPGQSDITTSRQETEEFEILSGVFEGKSTGAPICILIPNKNQKSADYEQLKSVYRPGHADFTYFEKYGIRDYRGGGRSSARITAAWVAAAAIVKDYLLIEHKIQIQSVVKKVGSIEVENIYQLEWNNAEKNKIRCPDAQKALEMENLIKNTAEAGDSLGGVISTRVKNCPVGLGEPLFNKLNADLAQAIFSINAVKGLEFGSGFEGSETKGSENNDVIGSGKNNDGGITGGISNGNEICFNTAFKPVSSISIEQNMLTVVNNVEPVKIVGRHDPIVLPRAVPIVEAMTAITIADHIFLNLKYKK